MRWKDFIIDEFRAVKESADRLSDDLTAYAIFMYIKAKTEISFFTAYTSPMLKELQAMVIKVLSTAYASQIRNACQNFLQKCINVLILKGLKTG